MMDKISEIIYEFDGMYGSDELKAAAKEIRQQLGREFKQALPKPEGWIVTKKGRKEDYYTVSDIEHALKASKLEEE